MDKNFNLIITGVGGQGIITLVSVLAQACLEQGYDVKSSELHGLSQRGGSVIIHIRFGKKVYSPLVARDEADLLISLELTEGLRHADFGNKDAKFLINNHYIAFEGSLAKEETTQKLKEIAGENLYLVPASKICKEKLDKEVLAGMYILGHACCKNLMPLNPESVLSSIDSVIPENYKEINIKAFNLANDN